MKALLLLLFILAGCGLSAQDSIVTIKTGNKVQDVLATTDIYYYPAFTNGKVFFRDGSKSIATLNYNRLFDQMLFINPKGDTLALADEKTIKFIVIENDTFYYDEGYIRLFMNNGVVKLAEKQIWVVADVRKIGTYNKATTTFAVQSLSHYTDGTDAAKSKELILSEDILLKKETQYFFGDKYNRFVRTGKNKVLQLFSREDLILENYLKENKVNFNKKEDLEKLAQYIAQLH